MRQNSILEVRRQVTEALGEGYEVLPESPAVGEHQSNGVIERAVDSVGGMARTLRASVEGDIGEALAENDAVVTWIIKHAAVLLALDETSVDGMSAYQRSRGKTYKRSLPRMAERVFLSAFRSRTGSEAEAGRQMVAWRAFGRQDGHERAVLWAA